MHHLWRWTSVEGLAEEAQSPVASERLSDWRTGQGCLENQSLRVGQAGGPDGEGVGGEHGCVGAVRREASAAAAAAGAEKLGDCGRSGGPWGGGLSLTLWALG